MYSFSELKKNIKLDTSAFNKINVAILGDSSTQFITIALKGLAYHYKLQMNIFEADYNQISQQVFNSSSELYAFKPQIIILFNAAEKLLYKFNKLDESGKDNLANIHLDHVAELNDTLTARSACKIIYFNLCEINNSLFGSYSNKVASSFIYQVRKINYGLMQLAEKNNNLFICDISSLQNQHGRNYSFSPSVYLNTDAVFSLDFVPLVAKATMDIIACLQGKLVKCVILDLDNTLWGGVIGDDGMENIQIGNLGLGKAFTEFQYWLKALKQRGILLAVCSKNTESVAKQPFLEHPDMVLKLDDLAIFVANWETKVDNIKFIQSILNIGFDSMVFLDDNPFERNMVKQYIPDVIVPELPEDPAAYLEYLCSLNLFETVSISKEDSCRTDKYREEAGRMGAQKSFADESEFLASLEMRSDVQLFNKFNLPRVAQLIQRSNQFNLRTIRYSEAELEKMISDDQYFTFAFTLEDKYGDSGLIAVALLKKEDDETLFIDTWLMSCRVLKRGMEYFVLRTLVEKAKAEGFKMLKGQYLPTAKNAMVKDHYQSMGFQEQDEYWLLAVNGFNTPEIFITHE